MEYIADVQGFQCPENKFIFKELSVTRVENNAVTNTFCFLPPYDWHLLPRTFQCTNRWLQLHYHGIPWNAGTIQYSNVSKVLRETFVNCKKIYVKGAEKVNWLKQYLPEILIVDMEKEMRCPSLNTLPDADEIYCMNHRECNFPSCAVVNVNKLLKWMMERRNVFEGGIDEVDRFQCGCPDRDLCMFTVSSDSESNDEE